MKVSDLLNVFKAKEFKPTYSSKKHEAKPVNRLCDEIPEETIFLEKSDQTFGSKYLFNERKSQITIGKESKYFQVDSKRNQFKGMLKVYTHNSLLFTAINKKAQLVASPGLKIETDLPLVEDNFYRFVEKLNLNFKTENIARQLQIFGNCFAEIVRDGMGQISSIALIDPCSVVIEHDEYGNISNFYQEVTNGQFIELGIDDIIYFRLNESPTGIYGIGVVEPLWRELTIFENIQEGTGNFIYRKGFPKYDVTIGNKDDPSSKHIPKEVMDRISADFTDMNNKIEFVHDSSINIGMVDDNSKSSLLPEYQEVGMQGILMGIGVPKILMGQATEVNYASSQALLDLLKPDIKYNQDIILRQLNKYIFSEFLAQYKLTTDQVEICFNDFDYKDTNAETQKYIAQYQAGLITKELAQKKLGYSPDELSGEYKPEQPAFQPLLHKELSKEELDKIDNLEEWIGWSDKTVYLDTKDFFLKFIQAYNFNEIKDIAKSIVKKLRDIFSRAFTEGLSISSISNEIAPLIDNDKERAKMIARTESIRIANEGSLLRLQQQGIEEVKWDATIDSRNDKKGHVCYDLNGQTFNIIQAKGLIPAHTNCRCSWRPV